MRNALVPAVEAANRAGIPVITMNRRVNGGKVVAYVGADDVEGGRIQGRALVERLGSQGGAIIYLQGTPGSSPQLSREKGFKEVMAEHPEITLAADVFANFQEDRAKELMTGLVRRFAKGEIQAMVAQADEMALPAAEVAQAEGWDVPVIGFNGTAEAFRGDPSGPAVCDSAAGRGRTGAAGREGGAGSPRRQGAGGGGPHAPTAGDRGECRDAATGLLRVSTIPV